MAKETLKEKILRLSGLKPKTKNAPKKTAKKSAKRKRYNGNATVGTIEEEQDFPPGTFRRPDGRDQRSDTKIKNLRKKKK